MSMWSNLPPQRSFSSRLTVERRTASTIFSSVLVVALLGCAHDRGEKLSWNDQTILPRGESVTSLTARANDAASDRADRARAIFALFAHHIRPESSASEVHRVLTDATWLQDTHLYGVRALGGWVPVEMTFEDTVFCIHLLPVEKEKGWSPWVIYFRLSGKLRDEDALAFLRGESVTGNPKLVEFALCYPDARDTTHGIRADDPGRRRIERFSRRGIHIYEL